MGDASVDYFVRVPHLATADGKAIGRLVGVHGGGMSANLAASAASAGAAVRLVTRVGADEDGRNALAELAALGVDVSQSLVERAGRTWLCFVQLDGTGEKALVGADTGLKFPAVADAAVPTGSSELVALLADDAQWAGEIAVAARAEGHRVAIDLEPDAVRPGDTDYERLIGAVDIVFMNHAAATLLGGEHAAARELLARGVSVLVISAGAAGATVRTNDDVVLHAKAAAPVDVVDTTGAGDALAGTMLGALASGRNLADALAEGVRAASRCVGHIGGRSHLAHPGAPTVELIQTTENAAG
ncbi:carbohydrate kinase family protein [Amycolatopsis jiangsuensis]|uniref:Ribokinase n=1 Tax=Amycolatopsis jiangsuensis TaxID=1181879 RepID=A0A840IP80_9PSEU|nr:carbohydrate kinase family protein [Amycolatopsis jiangsuensis]MBB4683167.1 ribokinase [Amycolatopsis jiangsuensis]